MAGWHHQLTGYEFEQALGDGEGQGSLACCSPWGCKESDTTEQLNWTDRLMDYNKCTTTSVTFQCHVIFGQLSSLILESLFMNILEHINHLSQFSHSVVSDSLRPHGLQHTRLPCPSSTAGACWDSCLSSRDAIQPSHPLLSPSPPAFNLPSIRVFSNNSFLCIKWPKYWGFSFSISPSNEYSRLISFRMDWLELLAVQGTLKSLLQHQSSILQWSAFFIVQLSHPYMTTGKTIALPRWT